MDELLHFDDFVGSDAPEHPSDSSFPDDESAALFRALTNPEIWEGPDSGLSFDSGSGSGDQSTPATSLGRQTSEATSDKSSPTLPIFSASPASFTSATSPERATRPVSANNTTGVQTISSATTPTPVVPTLSDAPAHSPTPGIASISPMALSVNPLAVSVDPLALGVDFAEAPIAFANMAPGSSQALYPPGPAYASQSSSGLIMQGPAHPSSGAAQAPALQPFFPGTMSGPFDSWGVEAAAPVAEPYPPQTWSAMPIQANTAAAAPSSGLQHPVEMMPPPGPAMMLPSPPPAMSPPAPAPSRKRTFEFVEPVVPKGFVANPDNHGRFLYANGNRTYLNGPKNKRPRNDGN